MKKLFIIFAVLCLAAPAMAADWNFYGHARFKTFWTDLDSDSDEVSDDQGTIWDQQGNSRIGAYVKFNDQIGGRFEYGTGVNLRHLYGTYTFGNGSQLLIGKSYTPFAFFYSNSVFDDDGDMLGVGEYYEARQPMIQWKMGGFKLALVKPNVKDYDKEGRVMTSFYDVDGNEHDIETQAAKAYDTDVTLPKIEAGYSFKTDMFFADLVLGYQTYKLDGEDGYEDYNVDSYIIAGGVGADIGAFFVKVGGHYGQNLGNFGAYNPTFGDQLPELEDSMQITNGQDADSDCWGALAVVGFNLSEMLTFEAGYGYERAEVDNKTEKDQVYVNATINIAPGFFIVPEVGMISFEEDNRDAEPEMFYAGAKWQINF